MMMMMMMMMMMKHENNLRLSVCTSEAVSGVMAVIAKP